MKIESEKYLIFSQLLHQRHVPWSDKSYLNESQIVELNKPHWLYCCLKTGEIAVVKYRVDHENGSKDFYYLSYGKGKWWRKNLFDELANQHGIKKDLYKAKYLPEEEGIDTGTIEYQKMKIKLGGKLSGDIKLSDIIQPIKTEKKQSDNDSAVSLQGSIKTE
ncbi:hypothetical protein N9E50_02890 [Alphaproteobacteria bacterium]|nr:hypothetical protein [Alphaproteobacteria bacterium]